MKKVLLFLAILLVGLSTALWIRHGGGQPYPNLLKPPQFSADALEEVLAYAEPIGNVAVSSSGRIFFTVHPESRPGGNKLLEYVNGASVPFPSLQKQAELFDTPLGLVIDKYDRLWVIDHGNHGMRSPHIVAIDLVIGDVIRNQALDESIAPAGSILQDLQVSADGKTIVIADTSFWRKSPALIVYDIETGTARRVLENHESVRAQNYRIRTPDRDMVFLGGMIALRGGVDGIALGPEWLYYGALNGSGLYRVRLKDLRNESLPAQQLASRVERFSDKPLSDGFSIDSDGGVYITAIEHNAIFRVGPDRTLTTLLHAPEIRWPDALSFGPDGYLYVADSALSELVLQTDEHIKNQAPFKIFRFQPGFNGVPGQ
jgi:sugar lactone lactonase YvrE